MAGIVEDIVGELLKNENGYLNNLVDTDEATGGGTGFSGPVKQAVANNDRRVAKMTRHNRMSPGYTKAQGYDPNMIDWSKKEMANWQQWLQNNLPQRKVDASAVMDPMSAEEPFTVDAYNNIANETPQQRSAINTPAPVPSVPVSPADIDYTGAVGVPEYNQEYVNKAIADVDAGKYDPVRILRDAAYTAASVPMTAFRTGTEAANLMTGGAFDQFLNRYNEGSEAVKNMIASPQYLEAEQRVSDAIGRRDLPIDERTVGVLGEMVDNPLYTFSQAASALGSMAVPIGLAKGATALKSMPALANYAKYIPTAETASEIGNVLMNTAGTFSNEDMQNLPLWKRYLAGGISGAGTYGIGKVTEGGAEGALARFLGNEGRIANDNLLKAAGREGTQEGFEGFSDYTGRKVARGEDIDVGDMVAEQVPDIIAGMISGGGTHLGTRLAEAGSSMQQNAPQQEAPTATDNLVGAVIDAVQNANPPVQQAQQAPKPQPKPVQRTAPQPVQQAPAVQQQPVEQAPAPQPEQNPVDVIAQNGGMSREAMHDMGWTDNDIAKLPTGIVADKGGMSIEQARNALGKAGQDTDVEAVVDYASRPQYSPEQEEQPAHEQPQNIFGESNEVPTDWKSWLDDNLQQETQTEAKQAEPAPVEQKQPEPQNLTREDTQNRDRGRDASIVQMNGIASNPDYGRMSVSRSLEGSGAPVVYGDESNVVFGRNDVMTQTDGKKIPFRYGVVDAGNLIASNDINGTRVAEYDTGAPGKLRAIAGNGRTAGIKEAYSRGTAGNYRQALMDDADAHGVSADRIAGMKNPVLVRVIEQNNVNRETADLSNQSASMDLSATEQARNDARRVDWEKLSFDEETGNITDQSVIDFIREMPKAEQNSLINEKGEPTAKAFNRLQSAIFMKAYDSPALANRLLEQNRDERTSNILKAMMNVANKFVGLKDTGEFDITPMVVSAAEDAINAQKNNKNLNEYANNMDFTRPREADIILRMFATNKGSHRRISEALGNLADGMMRAYEAQGSMFGDSPTSGQAFNEWSRNYGDQQTGEAGVPEQRWAGHAAENDAGQIQSERTQGNAEETARPEPEEQPEEGLNLEATTPEQVKADEEKAKAEAKAKAAEAKKAEQKRKADEEVGHFSLSGSDSQEDVLIGQGQGSMFDNQGNVEAKAEQTAPESKREKEISKLMEKDWFTRSHIESLNIDRDAGSRTFEIVADNAIHKEEIDKIYSDLTGNNPPKGNTYSLSDKTRKRFQAEVEYIETIKHKPVLKRINDTSLSYDETGINEKISSALDVLAEEMGGEVNYQSPEKGKTTFKFKSEKKMSAFANKASGIIRKFTANPPKKIRYEKYVDKNSTKYKDAYNEAIKYAKDLNWTEEEVMDGIISRQEDLANLSDIDFLRKSERQIKDTVNGIAGFRAGLMAVDKKTQLERTSLKGKPAEEPIVQNGKVVSFYDQGIDFKLANEIENLFSESPNDGVGIVDSYNSLKDPISFKFKSEKAAKQFAERAKEILSGKQEEKEPAKQEGKKRTNKSTFDSKTLDTKSDTYKKAVQDEISDSADKTEEQKKDAVAFYKQAIESREGKEGYTSEDVNWYHGRLAGAEQVVKLDEVNNQRNTEEGKVSEQEQQKQEPRKEETSSIKPNDSLNGRDYESTKNAVNKMRKGEIAVEDLKRVALEALDNEESIKAGLNKLTIAALKPMVSFYTRGKKADYVNAAYDQLLFELLPLESFSTVYGGGQTFKQQYTDKVNSLTQDDIKKYSDKIKARRSAREKALTNPETLDEFRIFRNVNGYDALTSKQKAVYDDLLATKKREDAKQEKAKPEPRQKKTAPVSEVKAEIVETRHTKTGEPLYVVKLNGRVESDDFKSMRKTAGENSGYYSRYSKGFQFKDRDDAESFLNTINGNTTESEVQEAPEETAEQPVNKTVERMRDIAQANIDKAELKLNADRKTNTSRRARMAAGIEEDARKELRVAKTMMNIADAIESGEARHLADIKDMTQVVQLDSLLLTARYHELLAKYPEYGERLRHDHEEVTEDTVNYAKYPEADSQADSRKRLERAGIMDVVMLRAALREYAALRSDRVERDKVKDAERAIVGKKVGEDFFPTPPSVASRMAEMAGISEGDRVLEPSAGSGNLADAAKQAGGKVDAIEIDDRLRNILDAKGHEVVAEDFMSYAPSEKYDVVIMNPPFSNRRDAEHIMRAYDMLKDGGRLVAIAGEGVFFGRDKKAEAFRTWLDNHGAYIEKLPENTFADKKLLRTTGVNARLIKITKREDAQYATRSMPAHQSYSTVNQVTEALKADKANEAAIVVQSVSDLPEHLREQAEERDPATIEGVYDPEENKPYLIADNISDPERAIEVARHEVIAHYGIEGILGEKRMNEIADKVTDALKRGIKVIKEYSDRVNETHGDLDERTHAKEIIAKMSEDGVQNSVTKRIWNAIKSFLNKIGLANFDMTEKEVADILREARQAVIDRGQDMIAGKPASENIKEGLFSNNAPRNQYEKDLRDVLRGTKKNPINLGKPSNILQEIGFPDKPFMLKKAVINKVMREDKHGLTEDDLRKVPETLNEPMMVFESETRNGSFVVVTGEVDSENRPIVVTVNPDGQIVRISANEITSIYGKDKFSDSIERWVGEGLLLGAQKENVAGWLTIERAQTPKMVQDITSDNVINIPSTRKPSKALFSTTKPISNKAQTAFDTERHEFDVPEVTRFDNIRRSMQDRMIDLKKVQEAIKKDGGYITEREDVYGKEELYNSRLQNRIDNLDEEWITPILEAAKDTGMTVEEIDQWLAARHILLDKVNEKLAIINPDHPAKDRLSGMTDEQAQEIFHKGAGNKALYKVASLVDALTKRNVQQRVVNGLMTQAEAKQWTDTYKHYVPLKRDDGENAGFGRTKGMEVKGAESKRRMGSEKEVKNVLANIFADSVNVAQRIEKARVTRALLDLARNHANDSFWKVDEPKKVMRVDKQTGLVEMSYRDENLVPADNVLVVKENGKEHWIVFNKKNERAMRIAQAMKNMDVEQVKGVVGAVGKITRYMGQWMTSNNPAFMFSNFLRDVQDATFQLADTPISGKELQMIGHIPSAMKAIWQMDRGSDNSNTEMAKYAREFREAGGETAFIESRGTIKEQSEALEKRLKELVNGKPPLKKVMESMGGVIENANNAVENSVRLATYVTARKNGLSRDKAASIAKNITVNFNRRGTSTGVINSLWLFANANIQGHTRMLQAMVHSRKARIVGGALIAASFALSMLGRGVMGDLWDEITPWEKENNWIIPVGKNGDYIKIPIGPGLKLFHYAGYLLENQIFSKERMTPAEMAMNIACTVVDNFNVAGSGSTPGQVVSPTVFRPVVQLWENKKFNGAPIHAQATDPFTGYAAPAYQKAFGTTPRHWVAISKWLSNMSGGDAVKPGYINVAPESIAFSIKSFLIPGTANEVDRALTLSEQALGKEKITVSPAMVPLANRVYGHTDEGRSTENIYKQVAKWKQIIGEVRQYDKNYQEEMGYDKKFLRKKANKHLGWSEEGTKHLADLGNGDQAVGARIYKNFKGFQETMTGINRSIRAANMNGDTEKARALMKQRKDTFLQFRETGNLPDVK